MVHTFIAPGPYLQAVDNLKLYLSVCDEYKTCVSLLSIHLSFTLNRKILLASVQNGFNVAYKYFHVKKTIIDFVVVVLNLCIFHTLFHILLSCH